MSVEFNGLPGLGEKVTSLPAGHGGSGCGCGGNCGCGAGHAPSHGVNDAAGDANYSGADASGTDASGATQAGLTGGGGFSAPYGGHFSTGAASGAAPQINTAAYDPARAENVRQAEVVIIGGGLGGLSAALGATRAGLRPLVLEERGRAGGLVCSGKIGPITVDIGAESFAVRSAAVADLCRELGLETTAPQGDSWVWRHDAQAPAGGQALAIPRGTLGIPADLEEGSFLADLQAAAGADAVARARQDLELGPEVGAACENLADLVRARLGEAVLETFVRPIAGGIYAADPADLAVDTVAPGLRAALAECGSLTGAVAKLRQASPGAAVAAPVGGMFRLAQALQEAAQAGGAEVESRIKACHITLGVGSDQPRWTIWCKRTKSNPDPGGEPVETGQVFPIVTENLILATPGPRALQLLSSALGSGVRLQFHARREGRDDSLRLPPAAFDALADLVPTWTLPEGAPIAHVTLVLQAPQLDTVPRGSGMLVAAPSKEELIAGAVRAKALTHYSEKWPGVKTNFDPTAAGDWDGQGLHVLRVSYGRAGEDHQNVAVEDALRDASRLLGVELRGEQVRGSRIIHWDGSLPPHTPQTREVLAQFKQALAACPGLAVTGAWVAGSGIAAVVPDGLGAAQRLAGGVEG